MRAVIIGATGGIGRALTEALAERTDVTQVYALSRSGETAAHPKVVACEIDILDEKSVSTAATSASANGPIELAIVASGVLSSGPDRKSVV